MVLMSGIYNLYNLNVFNYFNPITLLGYQQITSVYFSTTGLRFTVRCIGTAEQLLTLSSETVQCIHGTVIVDHNYEAQISNMC